MFLVQIAENERAQQVSMVHAGPDFESLQAFDCRNYFPVNMLEAAASHYPTAAASIHHHQDQTALHLGYDTKSNQVADRITNFHV